MSTATFRLYTVCANIAGGRGRYFRGAKSDNDQVFVNHTRRRQECRIGLDGMAQVRAQIDLAVFAKLRRRFPIVGIQSVKTIESAGENSALTISFPVAKPPNGLWSDLTRIKFPQQLPGRIIQRDGLLLGCNAIDYAVDNEGAGF
jgi:hypothetical protein